MSVLACNSLFSILARRILRFFPRVDVTFFVDDSKLRGRLSDLHDLKGACEEFHRFDGLSGQQLNGKKCRAFGTTSEARRAARALLPPDGCLVYHLVSLGYAVHSTCKGQQALANARCERQYPILRRIGQLPFGKEEKMKYVSSCVYLV